MVFVGCQWAYNWGGNHLAGFPIPEAQCPVGRPFPANQHDPRSTSTGLPPKTC